MTDYHSPFSVGVKPCVQCGQGRSLAQLFVMVLLLTIFGCACGFSMHVNSLAVGQNTLSDIYIQSYICIYSE